MNQMLGMSPEQVRAKANILRTQLSVLESAANTVNAAALSSLNPLSYGIQPGGFVIAPFAIGGTQSAAAQVRAARESVLVLAQRLFDEADQQEVVSNASDNSYIRGEVPRAPDRSRSPIPGFWESLIGGAAGVWTDALAGATSFAVGIGDLLAAGAEKFGFLAQGGKVAGFLKVAGGIFSGLEAVTGVYEAIVGFSEGDTGRGVDGVISTVIGVAGVVGAIALAGTPVGWGIAIAGVAWGAAKLLCGDTPVSTVVGDFAGKVGGAVADGVSSAARGVGDFVEGLTNPLRSIFG